MEEKDNTSSFRTNIVHLTRLLSKRAHPRKQILINGLIGVALGAYSLNDKKITDLTNEMIGRYSELL